MSAEAARLRLIICMVLCLALVALWARSCFIADRYPEAPSGSGLRIVSWDGRVFLQWLQTDRQRSPRFFVLIPIPRIEGDGRNPDDRPSRHEALRAFESSIGTTLVQPWRTTIPRASLSNGLGFACASGRTLKSGGATDIAVRVVGVPFWAICAVPAGLSIHFWRRQRRTRGPDLCRKCGYDLRATPERCPECGMPCDRVTSAKCKRLAGQRFRECLPHQKQTISRMRKVTRRIAVSLAVACALFASAVLGTDAQTTASSNSPPCWPAIDGLGRALPTPEEAGPPYPDRFVGIFYFLTHNDSRPRAGTEPGPHDITKILAQDPEALQHRDSPAWGAPGGEYYWGEPLYGYYLSTDPWVIRRHAQLLVAAGVDTLIFDTTNTVTYPEVYTKICEVFTEIRKAGGRTPRIAFMVNTEAGKTADQLYHDLYEPGRFRDLWFVWRGKPLLICDPAQASEPVKRFFTLRAAHWPFTLVNTPCAWHWESTYPQVYGYTDDPAVPEQVNVAVAQNLRAADGKVTNMSLGDARGRSFHDGHEDRTAGAVNQGYNFAEQWKRALQLAPPFVMVTGWNEWTAGRFVGNDGTSFFVDQFDEEFSRDIEPMRGGHGDNYYYQLVANVRRYKGAAPLPKASAPKTIDLAGSFDQWQHVAPSFHDDTGDTQPRDFAGASGLHYSNSTGRNDLVEMKVARDAANVYCYARVAAQLSPRTDPNWMWLLLSTGQPGRPSWEGCDFIVNRTIDPDGSTWLESCEGGWHWKKIAKVELRLAGSELQLGIPRKFLNLPPTGAFHVDFKWADNLQHPGDVTDFYLSGDVAPEGRFMFRYSAD